MVCAALVSLVPMSLAGQARESRLDRVFTGLIYRPLTEGEAGTPGMSRGGGSGGGEGAAVVSPHDASVLYRLEDRVFRSDDEGGSWTAISPDLTLEIGAERAGPGGPGGALPRTLTALAESPLEPGLIWVGGSDGYLTLTRDGGASWTVLDRPAGAESGVRMVVPSAHRGGRAYVVAEAGGAGEGGEGGGAGERAEVDGAAEAGPLVYRTDDYGSGWTLLSGEFSGLPREHPVTVLREDPEREGLLFAGTPVGVFVTFDDGGSWDLFQFGLPEAPVTDLRILGRDLVVDLFGRGPWMMDELGPLRQVMDGLTTGEPYLFEPSPIYLDRLPDDEGVADARGAIFDYLLPSIVRRVQLEVLDAQGVTLVTFSGVRGGPGDGTAESDFRRVPGTRSGVHRIVWDLTVPGQGVVGRVPPGNYLLRMTVDGLVRERTFEIVPGR